MPIPWPVDCNTPRERTELLYRLQEKLRLLHNALGAQVGDDLDLTGAIYNPVRAALTPYEGQRWTLVRFRAWLREWWDPRAHRVSQLIVGYRAELRASTAWDPDPGDA